MNVVLRCPTCGTTQGDAGECEACSDGEVRYFCTNHDGGMWLNGPVCASCASSASGRRSRRDEPEPAEPEVLPPTPPSLGELLEEIAEERARGRARYEVEDAPWAKGPAEARRPGFPLAGCLVRIVGLVFLLIAAAIIFLFLLFAGFIVN